MSGIGSANDRTRSGNAMLTAESNWTAIVPRHRAPTAIARRAPECDDSTSLSAVMPAHAGIQYAAATATEPLAFRNTGSPLSRRRRPKLWEGSRQLYVLSQGYRGFSA